MKKIINSLMLLISGLQAMEQSQIIRLPAQVVAALKELSDSQEINESLAKQAQRSVPDFFGLFSKRSYLPEGLKCCEDPCLKQIYLDNIENPTMRRAIALNCLGLEIKQKRLSLIGAPLFAKKYHLNSFFVDEKDITKAFSSK